LLGFNSWTSSTFTCKCKSHQLTSLEPSDDVRDLGTCSV
jgi:hypothetical protein